MVKINYRLTDNVKNITKNEFESELNELFGYFEICFNKKTIGYCPNRELIFDEEGPEMVLYWLIHLLESIVSIKNNEKYEIHLLSLNTIKLVFNGYKDDVNVFFVKKDSCEIEWKETVKFNEFYRAIMNSSESLLNYIKENNLNLLSVKQLIKLSNLYRHVYNM